MHFKTPLFVVFATVLITACSSSESSDSNGGDKGSSGSSQQNGANGSASGTCSGAFTDCKMGTLSEGQFDTFCTTALKTSGVTPGKEVTCDDGTTVTIQTAEKCVANFKENVKCKAFAETTAGDNLDCAIAAFKEPCSVLDGSVKACTTLISALKSCQ